MKVAGSLILALGLSAVTAGAFAQSGEKGKAKAKAKEKEKARPAPRKGEAPPAATPAPAPAARPGTAPAPAPAARPGEAPAPAARPGEAPAPAPAARPAPAPVPTAAPVAAKRKPVSHYIWLRNLSSRINRLKERISVKKREIDLLKEAVLHGTAAGAHLVLVHVNKLGSSFRLVSMRYTLDRRPILIRRDLSETRLGRRGSAEIYNGPIRPGRHTLTVELKLRGHGYGVYSYLKGYRFQVLSRYSFNLSGGSRIRVEALAFEKADVPLKQRPAVKFSKKASVRKTAKPRKRGK